MSAIKGLAAIVYVGGVGANLADVHHTGKRFLELRANNPQIHLDQKFFDEEGRFLGRYAYDVDSFKWIVAFYTISKNRMFNSYERPKEYD